jgi:hypothetical protein
MLVFQIEVVLLAPGHPGPNPTTLHSNASVVNLYNAMSSLARFEIKNNFVYF